MNTVRNILAAAAVAAIVVTLSPPAGADPTPGPSPGYQIPGPDGPQFPGVQTYQPSCLRNMLACGFRYDPATGTWRPGGRPVSLTGNRIYHQRDDGRSVVYPLTEVNLLPEYPPMTRLHIGARVGAGVIRLLQAPAKSVNLVKHTHPAAWVQWLV
jgi:hypothetical protein